MKTKSMKYKQFIILTAIFGLCLLSAPVVGNETGWVQTVADSIIADMLLLRDVKLFTF